MKNWIKALFLEIVIMVSGSVLAGIKETEAFNFEPLAYTLLAAGAIALIATGAVFLCEVLYD